MATIKNIFLTIIFSLSFAIAFAQEFPSELWHDGKVVLTNEDTIRGKVKYDLQNDVVQVNIQNVLKTYSARKLLYFEIFDKTINNYRYFYSIPYNVQSDYKVPMLFEVLYEGKLSLLCREEIVKESMPNSGYSPYYYNVPYYNPAYGSGGTRTRLAYKFYFMDDKGNITDYSMKKSDLLSKFDGKQKEIKQYMKKNNLKYDRMRDLVRITAYYNALLNT